MPKLPAERKTPRIRVSSPCPKRWESLIPVVGGRHCAACRKTVIDVERLTSAEVAALVESGERACVRVATLPDGSVLTRDHPRAARRVAAWAGAALAVSTFACSERVGDEEVAVCADRETQESEQSAVVENARPSVHRSAGAGPTVQLDRAALVTTVGRVETVSHGGAEAPPPLPAFDLTAPISDQAVMLSEAVYVLGSFGESSSIVDATSLPPFEIEFK